MKWLLLCFCVLNSLQYVCLSESKDDSYDGFLHEKIRTDTSLEQHELVLTRSKRWFRWVKKKAKDIYHGSRGIVCKYTNIWCDKTKPKVYCHLDGTITIIASPRMTYKVFNWKDPTATDNVGVTKRILKVSPNNLRSGSRFKEGTHKVKFTAWDRANNWAFCGFEFRIKVVRCRSLPSKISHGYVVCSSTGSLLYGDYCDYKCQSSYKLVGNARQTCSASGVWTGGSATCESQKCRAPSLFGNTEINRCVAGYEYNSQCQIKCKTGYINPNGNNYDNIRCVQGSWTQSSLSCIDGTPPTLSNCPPPFTKYYVGKDNKTADVQYDLPTASDKTGRVLPVKKVSGISPGNVLYDYNNQANNMYLVKYTATDSTGIEASNPCSFRISINVVTCPSSGYVQNGNVSCTGNHNPPIIGDICTFTCDTGYERTGDEYQTCGNNGQFSGNISVTCNIKTCPAPTVPDYVNFNVTNDCTQSYNYNSKCQFVCQNGYFSKSGTKAEIICRSNKTWSQTDFLCKDASPPKINFCPPSFVVYVGLDQKHAVIQYILPTANDTADGIVPVQKQKGPAPGDKVLYDFVTSVNNRHTIIYTAFDSDNFEALEPCVITVDLFLIRCPVPSVHNGSVTCTNHNPPIYGDECQLTCDTGYKATGDKNQTCQKDGKFSGGGTITCDLIKCSNLTIPPNVNFDINLHCTDTNIYGSRCNFYCKQGFFSLSGQMDTIQCKFDGDNGVWSETNFNCTDASPPEITYCPKSFVVYVDESQTKAYVNYSLPTAHDKTDGPVAVRMIAGVEPNSYVTYNTINTALNRIHMTYTATDSHGQEALQPCQFTIDANALICSSLIQTPKLSIKCTDPLIYGANCSFACNSGYPIFGPDLVQCKRLDGNPPTTYWDWGAYKNQTYCGVTDCPDLRVPKNGSMACGTTKNGKLCKMSCNSNYDIPRINADPKGIKGQFFCDDVYGWINEDVPDCTSKYRAGASNLPAELFYFSGDCTSQATQDEIKRDFITRITSTESGWSSRCIGYPGCTIDKVTVSCGAKSGKKKKRSAWTHIAVLKFELITLISYSNNKSLADLSVEVEDQLYNMFDDLKAEINKGSFDIPGLEIDKSSLTSSGSDLVCPYGRISYYPSMSCVGCPTGQMLSNATKSCEDCSVGTYQDEDAQLYCKQCPTFHSTVSNASKDRANCIELCAKGFFSQTGMKPCSPCDVTSYQDAKGSKSCKPCPVGTNTTKQGSDDLLNCSSGADICSNNPCNGKGVCIPDLNKYRCVCTSGYTGFNCTTPPDPCINNLCSDASTCIPNKSNYTCLCNSSYVGRFCNYKTVNGSWSLFGDWSDCTSSCGAGTQTRQRICNNPAPKYGGLNCSGSDTDTRICQVDCIDYKVCSSEPCNGHGVCVFKYPSYQCICNGGFSGQNCTRPPDSCYNNFCSNFSTCVSNGSSYSCVCASEYSGRYCNQKKVNGIWSSFGSWSDCTSSCGPGIQKRQRMCINPAPIFGGLNCTGSATDTRICLDQLDCSGGSNCSSNPCQDHGMCISDYPHFRCVCYNGYTGTNCSTPPNPCDNNLCYGFATCLENGVNYTCICPSDHSGEYCDQQIVHGEWSAYGDWSSCSASCGLGSQFRLRYCNSSSLSNGGIDCAGHNRQSRECPNQVQCKICDTFDRPYGVYVEYSGPADNRTATLSCISEGTMLNEAYPEDRICGENTGYVWYPVLPEEEPKPDACVESSFSTEVAINNEMEYEVSDTSTAKSLADGSKDVYQNIMRTSDCIQNTQCKSKITSTVTEKTSKKKRSTAITVKVILSIKANPNLNHYIINGVYDNNTAAESLTMYLYYLDELQSISDNIRTGMTNGTLGISVNGLLYYPTPGSLVQTAAVYCQSGKTSIQSFCTNCPQGTSGIDGNCFSCKLGTYQDKEGQTVCVDCPHGYTTSLTGCTHSSYCSVEKNDTVTTQDTDSEQVSMILKIAIPLVTAVGFIIIGIVVWKKCNKKRIDKDEDYNTYKEKDEMVSSAPPKREILNSKPSNKKANCLLDHSYYGTQTLSLNISTRSTSVTSVGDTSQDKSGQLPSVSSDLPGI